MVTTEMVDWNNMAPGSRVNVGTKHRLYEIECLGGNKIMISGHPDYCPTPVLAHLVGSVPADGGFEPNMIVPGSRMMFIIGERSPVTTSRVVNVKVEKPVGKPSIVDSNLSIH